MHFFEILLVIIIAVVIHEIGHVIGAKIVSIKIKEASLGFGPTIFECKLGSIKFKFCWLLMGAYVVPEGSDEEFLAYTRIRRIVLTASGLIMSIILLPVLCLFLLKLIEGNSFHITTALITMIDMIFLHPFHYFYSGITEFPHVTFTNQISNYISCLAEVSLFLGIINALPIPVLDGGNILLTILEKRIPKIRRNYSRLNKMGYWIILTITLSRCLPGIEVFILNIKTTFPIFLLMGYIIYRFIKIKV